MEFDPKVPRQRPASPVESIPPDAVVTPIRPNHEEEEEADLQEVAGPSPFRRAVPALGAVLVLLVAVRFLARRLRKS